MDPPPNVPADDDLNDNKEFERYRRQNTWVEIWEFWWRMATTLCDHEGHHPELRTFCSQGTKSVLYSIETPEPKF